MRGAKPIGYELTETGWNLIKDLLALPPVEEVPAPRPAVDRVQVIRSFGPYALKFTLAQERLDQIASREAELAAELPSSARNATTSARFWRTSRCRN